MTHEELSHRANAVARETMEARWNWVNAVLDVQVASMFEALVELEACVREMRAISIDLCLLEGIEVPS